MSLKTFSVKPVGTGHSKSFADCGIRTNRFRHNSLYYWIRTFLPAVFLYCLFQPSVSTASPDSAYTFISEEAANDCIQKWDEVETFADEENTRTGKEKTTRFTEEEINSYLTLKTDSDYKSCLNFFRISFTQDILQGITTVDFDCLKEKSEDSLPNLITRLFSGTHVITARGEIKGEQGEGYFKLHEIRFDDIVLPKILVEHMISSACLRLESPFDPMQSTAFPFKIRKVTVHSGYIMVFQ